MKNVPPIVWQLAALAAVVAAGYYAIRKLGTGIKDAYSPGGVAYEAGNSVQDAIVPGADSLGTWLYGLFNKDPETTEPEPARGPDPGGYVYPGGVSYPARPGASPWIPEYLDFGYSPETGSSRASAGSTRNQVTRR